MPNGRNFPRCFFGMALVHESELARNEPDSQVHHGGVAENGKNRTPSHRQRPVSDLNRRACGVAARQAFQLHWVFGFRSLPPG